MSDIDDLRQQVARLEQRLEEKYTGPVIHDPPVLPYTQVIKDSGDPGYTNRLLVATPTTGLVRIEWVQARYGQIIPCNWSMVMMHQYLNAYIPLRYQVADAQNLIVKQVVEGGFEWLLLVEHDNILPADAFLRFNQYMIDKKVPVVSGLYYTRSRPSEPLVYRGRGTGYYADWKFGDLIWCDGVPTGALLIHGGLLRAMWDESETYIIQDPAGNQTMTRRVFNTPRDGWFDPETNQFNTTSGTSDLEWCTRVMRDGFFAKAGWHEYQELAYPFLIDSNIFVKHIDNDGTVYP